MPMDVGTLLPIFTSALASHAMIGTSVPQLAQGLADGLSMYALSGIQVLSVDVGTVGAGTGTGAGIILAQPILGQALASTFSSHGMVGTFSPIITDAIAMGVSLGLLGAIINTVNAGVGVGAGTVQLLPTPGVGTAMFSAAFLSAGIVGVFGPIMADAVAMGIDLALPSAVGVIVIAGPPAPAPGAGAGTGKLT